MSMTRHRLVLTLLTLACAIGILAIASLEIWALNDRSAHVPRVPYSGYLFALFILTALWSLYVLTRGRTQVSRVAKAVTVGLLSFGIAGIVYFIVIAGSLVCCEVEGVKFVNSHFIVVLVAGLILGVLVAAWRGK